MAEIPKCLGIRPASKTARHLNEQSVCGGGGVIGGDENEKGRVQKKKKKIVVFPQASEESKTQEELVVHSFPKRSKNPKHPHSQADAVAKTDLVKRNIECKQ